ncbi:hypothetical protein SDC9_139068 [bioreactor metagenome]|uniref:Uncharacterized protein n=1 Tax=bioreactor metagenome TaxID=1076179 RepID=A0A645DR43_9ZZZZ
MPAQQGFHADQPAAVETDLGLVVNRQLAVLQRAVQRAFQGQAAGGVGIHFRRIEAEDVAAGVLGARQRDVGGLHQFVDRAAVARAEADANAGIERDRLAVDREGQAESVEQALGEGDDVALVLQVDHHETELGAGPAADGVAVAH